MNKDQLIEGVAKRARLPKATVRAVVDVLFGRISRGGSGSDPGMIIAHLLRGHEVSLPGFGRFATARTSERVGVNPQTGEKIKIHGSRRFVFAAAGPVKKAISSRFVRLVDSAPDAIEAEEPDDSEGGDDGEE